MADGNLSEAFAWAEKELGRELWPRERQFIATGGWARPDDFDWHNPKRPEKGTDENRFDAQLIRWLLTKEIPDVTCNIEGVVVVGLYVESALYAGSVRCEHSIAAHMCCFCETLLLSHAQLNGLYLSGSSVPSLTAQMLDCRGNVHLRDDFEARGTVDLSGSRIQGQIDCDSAKLIPEKGPALILQAAQIDTDVLLRDGFRADGAIDLKGTIVAAGISVRSSTLNGSLSCDGMQISGAFTLENISGSIPEMILVEARAQVLNDDRTVWALVKDLRLSGFRFDSIQSDMTVHDRLAFLESKWERTIPLPSGEKSKRKDFDPQPYSQLAKVYDTMGHRGDAAKVRLRRDVRLASARLARAITSSTWSSTAVLSVLLALVSFLWSQLYRATFGFGYAPFRAFGTALVILLGTYVLAENTYQRGEFAPASPVVLASPEWLIASAFGCPGVQEPGCTMPLRRWEQSVGYRDYETFSPALYALDLFLPLDTLAQEESWSPSKDRGPWGWTLYWGRWLIQLSGWLLLTTAAAVFSGVLGKKD